MIQRPTYYTHSTCKTSSTEVDILGNVWYQYSLWSRASTQGLKSFFSWYGPIGLNMFLKATATIS